MQSHANRGMFLKVLDEREIGAPITALVNVFEIPDRLMRVNQQGEMKFWRHGKFFGLHLSSYREPRSGKPRRKWRALVRNVLLLIGVFDDPVFDRGEHLRRHGFLNCSIQSW